MHFSINMSPWIASVLDTSTGRFCMVKNTLKEEELLFVHSCAGYTLHLKNVPGYRLTVPEYVQTAHRDSSLGGDFCKTVPGRRFCWTACHPCVQADCAVLIMYSWYCISIFTKLPKSLLFISGPYHITYFHLILTYSLV